MRKRDGDTKRGRVDDDKVKKKYVHIVDSGGVRERDRESELKSIHNWNQIKHAWITNK